MSMLYAAVGNRTLMLDPTGRRASTTEKVVSVPRLEPRARRDRSLSAKLEALQAQVSSVKS